MSYVKSIQWLCFYVKYNKERNNDYVNVLCKIKLMIMLMSYVKSIQWLCLCFYVKYNKERASDYVNVLCKIELMIMLMFL